MTKKFNKMVPLSKKSILWYLHTASGFQSMMLYPNMVTMHAKKRYHLPVTQLKQSTNM